MKKLIIVAILLIASLAYSAGDTIYNLRGQGVQTEAPNYFETFADSAIKHSFNLTANYGTLYWSLYAPSGCTFAVTATSSTAGAVWHTIPALSRDGLATGYGKTFVHFSSCNLGQYRSMRGDWSQQ